MLKHLLILLASAFMVPSAFAVNNMFTGSYTVMDDDDDDDDDDRDEKDNHPIGIHRPDIICRTISADRAELLVKVRVRNKTDKSVTAFVKVEVEDQKDRKVATINDKVVIPAGKVVVSKNMVTIRNPHLHSVEPSYRYEAEAEVVDQKGEELSRSKERKFFISKNYGNARRHNGGANKVRRHNVKL